MRSLRAGRSSFYRWTGIVALAVIVLVTAPPGDRAVGAPALPAPQTYLLPASAFNITDHNLTYGANMVGLSPPADQSFSVRLQNNLVGNPTSTPADVEAQIGIGPGPAGPNEDNITPLLIVQEALSGFLRIEYIPFPMNDTYGYIVFQGFVATAGSAPFSHHNLTISYVESAPPVAPYRDTQSYGATTGNLSLTWDSSTLVARMPIAWANFEAFYAYGLHTGGFASGEVYAFVSLSSVEAPSPGFPLWIVGVVLGAAVGGAAGAVISWAAIRRGPPR